MIVVFPDPIVLTRDYLTLVVPGVPITSVVPDELPPSFITITSTGGTRENIAHEVPLVAVQVWATTWVEASKLARRVCAYLRAWPDDMRHGQNLAWAKCSTPYQFGDPSSARPRYQMTLQFAVRPETE